MNIREILLPWCGVVTLGMSMTCMAPCLFSPNPYLKRSVTDSLLYNIKTAQDDGKDISTILSLLQKKIPLINQLRIKRNMFGQKIVEITIEKPWIIIICEGRSPRVLTRTGKVAPAESMRDDILATLATITIDKSAESTAQIELLALWLARQNDHFFSRFSIEWLDKNDIIVRDESLPSTIIRATYETIFNNQIQAFLDDIREKNGIYTTIDLRFGDGQIILVPKNSRGRRG